MLLLCQIPCDSGTDFDLCSFVLLEPPARFRVEQLIFFMYIPASLLFSESGQTEIYKGHCTLL